MDDAGNVLYTFEGECTDSRRDETKVKRVYVNETKNIYTKTMITCDEDIAGQIYVGREELKVRSIGHSAMLEEDAMHMGREADVSAHVLDISGKMTQLRGLLDTRAVFTVILIETWRRMGFDKDDLIDSRIRL